jgi:hypothetical protein
LGTPSLSFAEVGPLTEGSTANTAHIAEIKAKSARTPSDHGNPPLRAVFETAFGLPKSIGTLDLDQQVKAFRDGAERRFGTADFAQFNQPDRIEDLIRSFTLRSDATSAPSPLTRGFAALTLLQAAL